MDNDELMMMAMMMPMMMSADPGAGGDSSRIASRMMSSLDVLPTDQRMWLAFNDESQLQFEEAVEDRQIAEEVVGFLKHKGVKLDKDEFSDFPRLRRLIAIGQRPDGSHGHFEATLEAMQGEIEELKKAAKGSKQ